MKVTWGFDAGAMRRKETLPIIWDTQKLVNGHCLLTGMSGAGKTTTLRRMITHILSSVATQRDVRIHVFDVHGDIDLPAASTVLFSEQTAYGLNPLRVNPDPHYGGVRKRVQAFINTFNRVSRDRIGGKQEAVLRNILYDVYHQHGFKQDNPATWHIDESNARLLSDGSDNRLYLNVPIDEKDQAKALGARWDGDKKCWWVTPDTYAGGITRWSPKTVGRTHLSVAEAVTYARRLLRMSFLGSDQEAVTDLEIFNKATSTYQRKVLEATKRGDNTWSDSDLQAALEKAGEKAVASYTRYISSIRTGRELDDVMKYDSTDVLKSVVDRLENLSAIGIFKAATPPFDPFNPVWRYKLAALSPPERKLFVLFRLEEIFAEAVQRGEQDDVVEIIILDEAHLYVDDDPDNILNTISKEARKFGLALIAASQSPTHFPDDFVSSVATKVILGIDEMYWRQSTVKMRIEQSLLEWIRPQSSMAVQMKERGNAKNEWRWVLIPKST